MRSPIPGSWHRLRAATLLRTVALAAAAACSGNESGGTPTPPPAESLVVSITPRTDTLLPGATRTFSADVRTTAGVPRTIPVDWSTLDPAIATVSNGTVTALAPGSTTLVARARDAADTALVVVRNAASTLTIEPNAVLATVGDTITFSASLAPPAQTTIIWGLSDSTLADFIAPATIRLRGDGELRVFARAGPATASAAVTIRRSPVASVSIAPSNLALAVGDTATLAAIGRDQLGRPLPGTSVSWSSSLPGIATVSPDGVVTALATGGAIITASIEGRLASAAVNVSPAPARSVTIELPNDSLSRGRTMQAKATPRDATGQPIVGRPLAWQSSNPSVATINAAGLITGIVAGQTTLSVIVDARIASVQLTVVNSVASSLIVTPSAPVMGAGSTTALVGEVRDQLGDAMPGLPLAWQATDPLVAMVDASGRVSAVTPGTADIIASSGTLAGTARVTVVSTTVATVSLAPSVTTVAMGGTATLIAVARDVSGNVLQGRPATWQTSSSAIATVSPSGMVTGMAVGRASITVTVEGASATAEVTVSAAPPPAIAAVSLTASPTAIGIGEFATSTATALDDAGKALPGVAFTFVSSDTMVAAVAVDGVIQGRGAGSATIAASAGRITGYASVTVQPSPPAPVASVHLTVSQSTLAVGDSATLTVTLRDAQGRVLTGRQVAFTSSAPATATVSAGGVLRGVAAGGVTITARSEGVSASVAITIGATTRPSVASVTVTLNAAQLAPSQGTQATAVLRDSAGNVLTGRAVAWTSSSIAVATVAQDGYVTAVAAGSATITAQSEGTSGSATVTVSAPPPPLNLTITALHLQQVVQDLAGTVPLVAGRDALLRVFVRATAANTAAPHVRVRLYNGTTLLRTDTIQAAQGTVPQSLTEGVLASTWNIPVAAPLVQPGLRIVADVDPGNLVPESDEGDNHFPLSGTPLAMDVRTVAVHTARLVPVLQRSTSLLGDATTANVAQWVAYARSLYPLAQVDADVRVPYTTNAPALQPGDANGAWSQVLAEVNALRTADASARYYYGVVRTPYNSGIAGLGLVGGRAAIGWDFLPSGGEVLAHELGHNFGRLHAPSCGAGAPDPSFPYAGGVIGAWGYDAAAGALLPPTTPDVMGNCEAPWASPYTYKAVLAYRAANPLLVAPRARAAAPARGLLVWGRVHRGRMTLEPSFEVDAPPSLPARPGADVLEGIGERGERLFLIAFDGERVADHPDATARHFAFVLPRSLYAAGTLAKLRWRSNGRAVEVGSPSPVAPSPAVATVERVDRTTIRVRWPRGASTGVLVRDAATGTILAFARDGEAMVHSDAKVLDVALSTGVRSDRRRVMVAPVGRDARR